MFFYLVDSFIFCIFVPCLTLNKIKMSNSYSSTIMIHRVVDIKNKKEVESLFEDILSYDGDLSENEDYFREDTIELGYESDVDRYVAEISGKIKSYSNKSFDKALDSIVDILGNQDYWKDCYHDIIELGDNKVSVCVIIGGDSGQY